MGDWFQQARFGMFVHWGHPSQQGWELSWPLVGGTPILPRCQEVPAARYHESARSFRPPVEAPRTWLTHARHAGMRYAVLTTKHHDGFALWPTRAGDFSVAQSGAPDLVGAFVEATRAAGLRVGLYFSLCDWHHPDYPAFTDADRPYAFGFRPRPTDAQWTRYLEFLFAQLRELLTDYGPIDLLWFDGGWERTPDLWRSLDLVQMIRTLQPGIVINDRLPGEGDFDTPEQFVPAEPPARPWETCLTMNESWGWNSSDDQYKSPRTLVHALCETASRGGNLLLNVSPMADGTLPAVQVERLDAIAGWMAANGEAIHDTTPGLAPWQFYGPTTRRGDRVFLHLLMRPYDTVTVRGVPIRRIAGVRALRDGRPLTVTTRCAVLDQMLNSDPFGEVIIQVPADAVDPLATVIELTIVPGI